jgi:2'-5' RNA ligase
MHRLFVAIRPPEPIRARLLDLMGGVAGARWQDEDQLHLTLRFIGEVDGRVADDVDAALQSVIHPPFDLALAGTGAFERRGQPATLWAGVAPQEPVKTLHKKIDHALTRAGVAPLQPFLEGHAVASPTFTVAEFRLYESRLTPGGAIHTLAARYSLS